MRLLIPILLLFILPEAIQAQAFGKWYGLVAKPNGNFAPIILHLSAPDVQVNTIIDLPSDNITGLVPSDILVEQSHVFIVQADKQLALDVNYNSTKDELKGVIVLSGKSYSVTFTKQPTIIDASKLTPLKIIGDGSGDPSLSPDYNSIKPIAGGKSLFIEELTWMDVRDALKSGKNSVIIATGGTEQSGPYVVTGKHNYILKIVSDSIAHRLGNALIAPIIPFVPEGNFNPPSGHLKYPGSISLKEATYEQLLTDIATSYKVEGFKTIIFFGDSGGNQWGMYLVANELNRQWAAQGVRVIYIPEYYDNNRIAKWLNQQGITEVAEGIHDSFKVEAQIAAFNPDFVRTEQRIEAGKFSINGVNLVSKQNLVNWGKKIVSYQTDITVAAIHDKLNSK